jgi:hypothetical protein
MPKHTRLNAFDMNCVAQQSPGLWTHPRDRADRYNTLDYWHESSKNSMVQVVGGLAGIIRRRGSAVSPIDPAANERTEQAPPRCGCAKGLIRLGHGERIGAQLIACETRREFA